MRKEFEVVAGSKWMGQILYSPHKKFCESELEIILNQDLTDRLQIEKGKKLKIIITDEGVE